MRLPSQAADLAMLVVVCPKGFRGPVSKSAPVPQLARCECDTTPSPASSWTLPLSWTLALDPFPYLFASVITTSPSASLNPIDAVNLPPSPSSPGQALPGVPLPLFSATILS